MAVALSILALGGCAIATVETPDPASVPSGSLEAEGGSATGPIVELDSGVMEGIGWRYAIYPSGDGWCTQLETVTRATTSCGAVVPSGDEVFASFTSGGVVDGGVTAIEGIVDEKVATVWLILEDGNRAPALLVPLDDAGLDGQAFVRLVPADVTITHLQAVALSGEILQTVELP